MEKDVADHQASDQADEEHPPAVLCCPLFHTFSCERCVGKRRLIALSSMQELSTACSAFSSSHEPSCSNRRFIPVPRSDSAGCVSSHRLHGTTLTRLVPVEGIEPSPIAYRAIAQTLELRGQFRNNLPFVTLTASRRPRLRVCRERRLQVQHMALRADDLVRRNIASCHGHELYFSFHEVAGTPGLEPGPFSLTGRSPTNWTRCQ